MNAGIGSHTRVLAALLTLLALVGSACSSASQVVVSEPEVIGAGEGGQEGSESGTAAGVEDDGFGLAPLGDTADGAAGGELDLNFGDSGDGEDDAAAAPIVVEGAPAGASMLTTAAVATETAESYRYELSFAMRVSDGSFEMNIAPDEPLATGSVVGTTERLVMDLGAMFDDMFAAAGSDAAAAEIASILGDDLRMETIVDGTSMYLYAPFLAEWADLLGGSVPGLDDLGALKDGWGVVDLTQVSGVTAEDLSSLVGAQTGGSFEQMLDLMKQSGVEVSEVGTASVRGVDTTHLRALVNMGAVLEAQGMSAADLGASGVDMAGLTLPFDVYVDEDERVRRVVLTMSLDTIRSAMPNEPIPAAVDFEMTTVFDVFDFGGAIDIDVPSGDQIAVDLTEAMGALGNL